jgi:DNA-binding transcriptional ArsR family regulator
VTGHGGVARQLTVDITEDNLSYMRTEPPLLAPIFRSDGQARLLSTLLLSGDELSITDLAGRASLAYPTVHREVARLVDAGILIERQVGRMRLVRVNGASPLVKPLREILTVATGPVAILADEFARIDGIVTAFLYGSFAARMLGDAGPAPHDIDVMVLGEPDLDAVYEACARTEAAVHRPVNPTVLTPEEFAAPSAFLDGVRSGRAVAVVGELPWR